MTRLFTLTWLIFGVVAMGFGLVSQATGQRAPAFLPQDGVVLFQGDSITDGGRQRTGMDYNHIMGQDYGYILAAELGEKYPEKNVNFVNRGIGGNRVPDLLARWQQDTIEVKPDVLSILVGVNDTIFGHGEALEEYEEGYDKLLAETMAALPKVKIVLGEPFLLPVGRMKDTFPEAMAEVKKRQEVVFRLGKKYHLPVIAYQAEFDAACKRAPADHWSWDGVHPTYAGHALMAKAWLAKVEAAYGR